MADVEPKAPSRRRTHKPGEAASGESDSPVPEEPGTRDGRERSAAVGGGGETGTQGSSWTDPGVFARRAAGLVARLSGRRPESVIAIERNDEEWRVGVEVVEVSRIPDSADILAVYEVRLDADGDLVSYRRIRRYARGQLDSERQR
jgi:hypothetical protein